MRLGSYFLISIFFALQLLSNSFNFLSISFPLSLSSTIISLFATSVSQRLLPNFSQRLRPSFLKIKMPTGQYHSQRKLFLTKVHISCSVLVKCSACILCTVTEKLIRINLNSVFRAAQ